jgi:hypothetical protein
MSHDHDLLRTLEFMGAPMVGTTASQREVNMLVQLYRLPHGARIESDGSWKVVQ